MRGTKLQSAAVNIDTFGQMLLRNRRQDIGTFNGDYLSNFKIIFGYG